MPPNSKLSSQSRELTSKTKKSLVRPYAIQNKKVTVRTHFFNQNFPEGVKFLSAVLAVSIDE